jgi:hypothetical protein
MLYQDGVGNRRHGNENPDATIEDEDGYYRVFVTARRSIAHKNRRVLPVADFLHGLISNFQYRTILHNTCYSINKHLLRIC